MRQSLQLARASRFIGLSINPAELLRAPNSNGSFNPIELRARRTADILSGTINRLAHHRTDAAIIRQVLKASISDGTGVVPLGIRSEEHTAELQSLIRISYAVLCF